MAKIKPRIHFGLENQCSFMNANYAPPAKEITLVEDFLFFTQDVLGNEFPNQPSDFTIMAKPLTGEIYFMFPCSSPQSFSVTMKWEKFLTVLAEMIARKERIPVFVKETSSIIPASFLKRYFFHCQEVAE